MDSNNVRCTIRTISTKSSIKFLLDIYHRNTARSMTQELISKKALIMMVDDEEDILSIFSKYLTNQGHNVHAFSNPEIAVEHFRYSPNEFSLVLSDVRMHGMTGFQLARKVKELNPKVKVLLTSAFEVNMAEFEKVLPNTQVNGFLQKPVSMSHLIQAVGQHLNK